MKRLILLFAMLLGVLSASTAAPAKGMPLVFAQTSGDTIYDTLYVSVHDTVIVPIHDTIRSQFMDTTRVTDTLWVPEYDTQYVAHTFYRLQVISDDSERGVGAGSGVFPDSAAVEIAAVPRTGNRFVRWSDGSAQNPRRVVVVGDAAYTACFDTVLPGKGSPKFPYNADFRDTIYIAIHDTTYIEVRDTIYLVDTIFVTLRDTVELPFEVPVVLDTLSYGQVLVLAGERELGAVAGSGTFPVGTAVEIAAVPAEGYRFVFWHDCVKDNPRRVTVGDDVLAFVAEFAKQEAKPEPPAPEWEKRVSCRVDGLTLTVTCPASMVVRLFDMGGRLIETSDPCGDEKTESVRPFRLSQSGVCLVQVGPFPVKKVLVY